MNQTWGSAVKLSHSLSDKLKLSDGSNLCHCASDPTGLFCGRAASENGLQRELLLMFGSMFEATQITAALLQIKLLMSPQPWRAGILQRS